MTSFDKRPASELVAEGKWPERFWINSMGEYGHTFPSDAGGIETVGGTLNLTETAAAAGVSSIEELTDAHFRRAETRALHEELVHPLEFVVHRMWSGLREAGSDLWRFYAGVEYGRPGEPNPLAPKAYDLTMTIEYVVLTQEVPTLKALAQQFGAEADHMIDREEDGKTLEQWGINFDIRSMGLGQITDLQARWLIASNPFTETLVSVL